MKTSRLSLESLVSSDQGVQKVTPKIFLCLTFYGVRSDYFVIYTVQSVLNDTYLLHAWNENRNEVFYVERRVAASSTHIHVACEV